MDHQYKVYKAKATILSTNTQLQVLALITMPELSTVSLPSVPNWLISPLKPRAQLCYSGPELCHPGTKKDKRISWQGSVMSSASKEIKFWYKNLN